MADFWNTDWLTGSAMFAPLRAIGSRLPETGWPDTAVLSAMAADAGRIVNARGQRVRFVPQSRKSDAFEAGFEPRAFLTGEVQVRPRDWHDLFNALAWMTFPTAKAVINARHYESMATGEGGLRPPQRDALTLFDEDGIVVLSSDAALLDLVSGFRWKELFWNRRPEVVANMGFMIFGHALYQKAMNPFVGMTGKAILLQVPPAFFDGSRLGQVAETDRLLALYLWDRGGPARGRDLAPLPVLGVPGWWPANERAGFYDNAAYFRPGRRSDPGQVASSI